MGIIMRRIERSPEASKMKQIVNLLLKMQNYKLIIHPNQVNKMKAGNEVFIRPKANPDHLSSTIQYHQYHEQPGSYQL
jgi:hypothetical protein